MTNRRNTEMCELYRALAKAQSEMEPAKKQSTNPFFKSKYSDLATVWETVKGPLSQNGLSITHVFETDGSTIILVTNLCHSGGGVITSKLPLILTKTDPQAVGSAITYYKRYALQAILALPSDDDDGEASMERIRHETLEALKNALKDAPQGTEKKILAAKGVKSLSELSEKHGKTFAEELLKRRAQK